jgi:hypothetical protein
MPDYEDVLTRSAVACNIVRLRPSAYVQIFTSGTETQIWEGVTDANGHFAVPTLPTGKYDLRVDGALVKSFHHVKADHVHLFEETWCMSRHGSLTASKNEDENCAIFQATAAGKIIKLVAVVETLGIASDLTVHLLKGAAAGASLLTCAGDSVWNRRLYNSSGSPVYRYAQADLNPNISLAANEVVTMGFVYAVAGGKGLTLSADFRPNSV